MDNDTTARFVPWFLTARYPDRFREVAPGFPEMGYALETDGACLLVRAGKAQTPFIWVRGGVAHAVPRTDALAHHIAAGNSDLMVGRLYMTSGAEAAMVVFDETILTVDVDPERQSSMQEVVNRVEASVAYTRQWSETLRERYGGRRFNAGDLMMLTL